MRRGGLDSDKGITSGVCIPVGEEPKSFADHLRHSVKFYRYFPAGVVDIFPIASNVHQNPAALLEVVQGAFDLSMQYRHFYAADTDLVHMASRRHWSIGSSLSARSMDRAAARRRLCWSDWLSVRAMLCTSTIRRMKKQ